MADQKNNVIRIEYDDDADCIIGKINNILSAFGVDIEFVSDEQVHDGFEIYELKVK